MIRSVAAAAALLSVPSIAAAPAAQFDLKCAGTQSTKSIGAEDAKPYASIYRIDLAQKKWCEGECEALHDIVDVQATQLTLEEENVDAPSERSMLSNTVDRQTGAHKITASSSSPRAPATAIVMKWEGSCEPAAFSGFPEIATKF